MSLPTIQSTARTTLVHPQQDTSFLITNGALPAGKSDDCDTLRGLLSDTINSAIDLNQAEERGEAVNGPEKTSLYRTLSNQAGSYRSCDVPQNGTAEDTEEHNLIEGYRSQTRWGSTPELAIGRLANE